MTRLWTQLRTGSGTEGEDCGALAVINLAQWGSRGKVGPSLGADGKPRKPQDPKSVASWVRFIRRIAKRPSGAMLINGDILEALTSKELRAAFTAAGCKPLRVQYHYGISYAELRQWLAASDDRAAMLPVMYGVARRDGAPMGSTTFDDGHALVLVGARKRRVKVRGKWRRWWYTTVGDPLMDGRRKPGSTRRYPKGWKLTRIWFYRAAAGAFGSDAEGKPNPIGLGRAIVITVERS